MVVSLLLTFVALICYWLAQGVISSAPFDSKVKWGLQAIAVIISILVILSVWGISFPAVP